MAVTFYNRPVFREEEHPRDDETGRFIKKGKKVSKIRRLFGYSKTSTNNEFKNIDITPTEDGDYHQIKEEYENAVDNDIINFYNNQLKQRNPKGKLIIGTVTQKHISEIKRLIGCDVTGYKISINDSFVGHIYKNHGKNGEHDHSMKDVNDIGRIRYILNHFDKIDFCRDKNGEIQYSHEHKDKYGNYAPKLLIQKRINGYFVICEAVAESSKKELRLISAYKPNIPII